MSMFKPEIATPPEGAISADANGWFPISIVPEGEHVLLWFPNGERGIGGIETAMVFRREDGSLDTGGWTHGGPNSGSDWEFCEPPTHWQPLPEGPIA